MDRGTGINITGWLKPRIARQTLRQAAAPQPPLVIVWLPILLIWAAIGVVSADLIMVGDRRQPIWQTYPHSFGYWLFSFNVLVTVSALVYLMTRHRSSFWSGWHVNWRGAAWVFVIWMCLFILLRLPPVVKFFRGLVVILVTDDPRAIAEGWQVFEEVYFETLLGRSAYGPTAAGLFLTMLFALIFPLLEEIQFSAAVSNRFLRRHHLWMALMITPTLYVLFHIAGWGELATWSSIRDWFLFGTCYLLMRIYSGNIILSIGLHLIFNLLYSLPYFTALFLLKAAGSI